MKRLFSKLFFASDSSRGMSFALTLVTVGNYLWFSFCHILALGIGEASPVFFGPSASVRDLSRFMR